MLVSRAAYGDHFVCLCNHLVVTLYYHSYLRWHVFLKHFYVIRFTELWPLLVTLTLTFPVQGHMAAFVVPRFRKSAGTLNLIRLSVRPSVPLSVTKTLTLAITFALLQVELWYLACMFFVTRPFRWYHVGTLTVTFDLLQGQICCRAEDHNNSLNLLVSLVFKLFSAILSVTESCYFAIRKLKTSTINFMYPSVTHFLR